MHELILILDFGGQYKELISRLTRSLNVYSEIKSGKIKQGEKKTYSVKLTNNGKSKLLIRKIDTGNSILLTADAPKEINAGASADLAITFDTKGQSGEQSKSITLITNDPKNPQITIRLKADITE
jgi:hypothetical protein